MKYGANDYSGFFPLETQEKWCRKARPSEEARISVQKLARSCMAIEMNTMVGAVIAEISRQLELFAADASKYYLVSTTPGSLVEKLGVNLEAVNLGIAGLPPELSKAYERAVALKKIMKLRRERQRALAGARINEVKELIVAQLEAFRQSDDSKRYQTVYTDHGIATKLGMLLAEVEQAVEMLDDDDRALREEIIEQRRSYDRRLCKGGKKSGQG